jgi:hypothetical protein
MPTPREIILIDDKSYGLAQIENAIPGDRRSDYAIDHFTSFAAYAEARQGRVFLVLLDFFLDEDATYGNLLVPAIKAEILIGFSSMREGSKAILKAAREQRRRADSPRAFAVQKLKGTDRNPALDALFREIL